MAATRSFEPDPHREMDLIACVKGMSKGCTRSTGWNPRVGLAYRATNDTVVRAGYGVYANMITAGMLYGNILNNPRANATTMTFQTSPDDPSISLSNPFVVSTLVPGSGLPNVAANQVPLPQTYMNNWGLSIQQELTPMNHHNATSRDGRKIIFCRSGIGESPAIWIMDSDGKSLALLTRGLDNRGAVGPAWLG